MDRYECEKLYIDGMSVPEISKKTGCSQDKLRAWKSRHKWDLKRSGKTPGPLPQGSPWAAATKGGGYTETPKQPKQSKPKHRNAPDRNNSSVQAISKKQLETLAENSDLNEKQKRFCFLFTKYNNATRAYREAYECDYNTARTNASILLTKPNIQTEIKHQQAIEYAALGLYNKESIIQQYYKIAFGDINDILDFKNITPMRNGEPITITETIEQDGEIISEQKPLVKTIIRLKDGAEIDGQLISSISEGRDGLAIKTVSTADRLRALEWLAKNMHDLDVMDAHRRKQDSDETDVEHTSILVTLGNE